MANIVVRVGYCAVYAGVISSVLNYYLLVVSTQHLSPLIVSIFGVTQPLVTDLLNYFIVGKVLSIWVAMHGLSFDCFIGAGTTYSQMELDSEDVEQRERLLVASDSK